jgi:IMP dehydrogenase
MNTTQHFRFEEALTYDDIQLVPSYSEIKSRRNIDLTTRLTTNYNIKVPLIASPMDTICEAEMAMTMGKLGGIGCIHRFMSIGEQAVHVKLVTTTGMLGMGAVGANGDYVERAQELVNNGASVILIDVAHGWHSFVREAIDTLKKKLPSYVDIVAGNVATAEAALALQDWGADAIRVGVGGGSLCTTRVKTGFGVPNVTSLIDISERVDVPVIACGGVRTSGDISKALACGASSVILGSLLSGTKEAPGPIIEKSNGLYKRYRGAASLETKSAHGLETRNVEGESTVVPFKGGVRFIVEGLLDGIRSALSYAGAESLNSFHPKIIKVTNSGALEAKPHLLF